MLPEIEDLTAGFTQPVAGEDLNLKLGLLQHGAVHRGRVALLHKIGDDRGELSNLEGQTLNLGQILLPCDALHGLDDLNDDAKFVQMITCLSVGVGRRTRRD